MEAKVAQYLAEEDHFSDDSEDDANSLGDSSKESAGSPKRYTLTCALSSTVQKLTDWTLIPVGRETE